MTRILYKQNHMEVSGRGPDGDLRWWFFWDGNTIESLGDIIRSVSNIIRSVGDIPISLGDLTLTLESDGDSPIKSWSLSQPKKSN